MKRIGWIGAGIMGKSMVDNIINAGYTVSVYSRTLSKCDSLIQKGAKVFSSAVEVATNCDVLFTILGYPSDVREVILGGKSSSGLLDCMKPGSIVIDMTTSEPSLAIEIYDEASKRGISSIDAPVSGGDIGAKNATLSIMLGGDEDSIDDVLPLLKILGQNIQHMGKAGSGQHTKMVNQILISTNMIGVVEGLLYAKKCGLDCKQVIKAIGRGAAGSWSINNLGTRIIQNDYDPGFMVDHFLKDMGIALQEAEKMNLALPGLALAKQLYTAVKAQGHGKAGTQALMLVLERMNGLSPTPSMNRTAEEMLIRGWLKRENLNEYGDKEGTMYMGGTPLFDEFQGISIDWYGFMAKKFGNRPWLEQ